MTRGGSLERHQRQRLGGERVRLPLKPAADKAEDEIPAPRVSTVRPPLAASESRSDESGVAPRARTRAGPPRPGSAPGEREEAGDQQTPDRADAEDRDDDRAAQPGHVGVPRVGDLVGHDRFHLPAASRRATSVRRMYRSGPKRPTTAPLVIALCVRQISTSRQPTLCRRHMASRRSRIGPGPILTVSMREPHEGPARAWRSWRRRAVADRAARPSMRPSSRAASDDQIPGGWGRSSSQWNALPQFVPRREEQERAERERQLVEGWRKRTARASALDGHAAAVELAHPRRFPQAAFDAVPRCPAADHHQ